MAVSYNIPRRMAAWKHVTVCLSMQKAYETKDISERSDCFLRLYLYDFHDYDDDDDDDY